MKDYPYTAKELDKALGMDNQEVPLIKGHHPILIWMGNALGSFLQFIMNKGQK